MVGDGDGDQRHHHMHDRDGYVEVVPCDDEVGVDDPR